MFLAATLPLCLLLPQVQSQAVGRVNEDVWVEGKLGSKVKVFWFLPFLGGKIKVLLFFPPSNIVVQVELGCEEDEDATDGCPPNCVWNGPQGGF